jgi:dihydrofolate synthase / folylpolyglutamate synthase
MTYDEAIAFWYGRINYEVRAATPADLKLERMRSFLARLDHPQDRVRIIHVTGTKGKGSTAAMLASVLQAAGHRVGLFTSPHLVHVEERLQVNGQPISHAELTSLIAELEPTVRALDPTFFEIGTALGFLHFVRRRVDVAILEVGLGGRYDSTNVCQPMASVITSIGYDHMAQLGDTLEGIAYQKAGIIKPRVPIISGVQEPGPAAVIAAVARESHAPLHRLGVDFHESYQPPNRVTLSDLGEVELGLLGRHQAQNAAVAVRTLRVLPMPIDDATIRRGLANVRWPARIEVVRRTPTIILDSAHNVPSATALVATLREAFPHVRRKHCIFAVSSDKQYEEILQVLGEYFDEFHVCRYGNNPRAVPVEKLRQLIVKPTTCHPTALEAWAQSLQSLQSDGLIAITGSVFLAGELQDVVRSF